MHVFMLLETCHLSVLLFLSSKPILHPSLADGGENMKAQSDRGNKLERNIHNNYD